MGWTDRQTDTHRQTNKWLERMFDDHRPFSLYRELHSLLILQNCANKQLIAENSSIRVNSSSIRSSVVDVKQMRQGQWLASASCITFSASIPVAGQEKGHPAGTRTRSTFHRGFSSWTRGGCYTTDGKLDNPGTWVIAIKMEICRKVGSGKRHLNQLFNQRRNDAHTCQYFGGCRTFPHCLGQSVHMQGRVHASDQSSAADDREQMHRWTSDPTYRYTSLVISTVNTKGPFFVAYQNLPGRCLVCKHGSHVISIPKADWSSVKNKQLTATPC